MAFLSWLEHTSVSTWINQSNTIFAYPTVLLLHTIGLTLLVGINISIDLRLLGFAPQIPIVELRRLFPVMWTGFVCSAVTGALLLAAKATVMVLNPAFWVKMICIALAIAVFFVMKAGVFGDTRSERQPIPANGRLLALASLALWLVAITAGRVMAYVGEAAEFAVLILT